MVNFSLEGKVALVTGASYGIGFALATAFARQGAKIVFNDIKQELVDKGLAAYKAEGIEAKGYVCDVTNEEQVNAMIAQIEKEVGVVDILVNNAGVWLPSLLSETSEEQWLRMIDINLNGTFTMMNAVYPHFKAAHAGTIVNVSSVAGKIGGGLLGTAAYASSKAGVNGLTKAVAKEGGKFGVRCNAVCPSLTLTDMTSILSDENSQRIINGIPLGRAAQASEPAQMVLFFASDLASFVNGEIGDCDGGIVLDG